MSVARASSVPTVALKLPRWRARFMFAWVMVAFAVMLGRAFYLQGVHPSLPLRAVPPSLQGVQKSVANLTNADQQSDWDRGAVAWMVATKTAAGGQFGSPLTAPSA